MSQLRSDGSRWDALSIYREADDTIRTRLMRGGTAPSVESLVGWEFDGINTALVGAPFRKFRKGFYRPRPHDAMESAPVYGFNVLVHQDGVDRPHRAKPSESRPRRHGPFGVMGAPPKGRYSDALLLDYSAGERWYPSPETLLRDYLVQIYPDDPDLLLGHAFGALPVVDRLLRRPGGRVSLGFFVLVRGRPHDFVGWGKAASATR